MKVTISCADCPRRNSPRTAGVGGSSSSPKSSPSETTDSASTGLPQTSRPTRLQVWRVPRLKVCQSGRSASAASTSASSSARASGEPSMTAASGRRSQSATAMARGSTAGAPPSAARAPSSMRVSPSTPVSPAVTRPLRSASMARPATKDQASGPSMTAAGLMSSPAGCEGMRRSRRRSPCGDGVRRSPSASGATTNGGAPSRSAIRRSSMARAGGSPLPSIGLGAGSA